MVKPRFGPSEHIVCKLTSEELIVCTEPGAEMVVFLSALVQALRLGSDKLISKLKIIHHEILDDFLLRTRRGDTFLVKFLPAGDVHLQTVALIIKDGDFFSQAVMGHFLKILLL